MYVCTRRLVIVIASNVRPSLFIAFFATYAVCALAGGVHFLLLGMERAPNGKRNGVARGIIIGEADKKSNESGLLLIRGAIKKLWPGNARNGGEEC
jgi:hypothetical protein